jgi:hypothetical protein
MPHHELANSALATSGSMPVRSISASDLRLIGVAPAACTLIGSALAIGPGLHARLGSPFG